jgi:glycosyltransferase involved in cell wall biosynthesis
MPVVVKEAMAMEVPVVASDEVGLPEIVTPEFGRLVPPGDPFALARALAELLAMTPEERAQMGKRARAFAAERANVRVEAERLSRYLCA